MQYSASNETYAGNWRWFDDAGTGIAFYEAALGTSPFATDAVDWQDVGLTTRVFFSMFDSQQLQQGQTYYLSVRATDLAGHTAEQSSNGLLLPAESF